MQWIQWTYIPGLHWWGWLQAGIQTREPWCYVVALVYALPGCLIVISRPLSLRLLLLSWLVSLVHAQVARRVIDRCIAAARKSRLSDTDLMQALLQAALAHGGCLTVTQGVMATGASFQTVERILNSMVGSGYVYQRYNPDNGILEYVFSDMS
jgi:predicted transcriptional regulator